MMLKFSGSVIWRLGTRGSLRQHSGPGAAAAARDKLELARDKLEIARGAANVADNTDDNNDSPGLVAAAFASLNSPEGASISKMPSPKSVKQSRLQQVDNQIARAADVNSLLAVAEMPVVSRKHALKMVSTLSEWSSSNKVRLGEFEKDPRFLKLCRILARAPPTSHPAAAPAALAEDLSTVLAITGDDEAARLITNLTLPQMIKVMKALQGKGRRSTPLLRALSHSITRQSERIDLKRSADLLYCCAALNFPDPVLLDRICNDVIECLPSNEDKPAVVNSIVISLGLMKYRHEPVLSAITLWLTRHRAVCRAGDIASAVVTLATLHYQPAHTDELVETALRLREEELARAAAWLDLVFALVTLRRAEPRHLLSTLQPEFIDRLLSVGEIGIPARRKLMMLDAHAALTQPDAPRLAEDVRVGVPLLHTKEKQLYVQSIMDTFKSLVSAEAFLKKDVNSGMGFLYDAEFAVDSKCHPVPLEKADKNKSIHRIAVLALDYHDMSRKVAAPLGHAQLCTTLLTLKGFKVLQIPYTEYSPKDKLVARVQYVEQRIRTLVSEPQA